MFMVSSLNILNLEFKESHEIAMNKEILTHDVIHFVFP